MHIVKLFEYNYIFTQFIHQQMHIC